MSTWQCKYDVREQALNAGDFRHSDNLLRNVCNLLMIPAPSVATDRNSGTELTTADKIRSHAAPAGGAPSGGRGCDFLTNFIAIPNVIALFAAAVFAASASAQSIILPSDRKADLQEVLKDMDLLRYRFVVPELSNTTDDLAVSTGDLEFLCSDYVLQDIAGQGLSASQVVISMGDRPTEFGVADPDALQVFELFSISDGLCIWEAF